tara:strand:+ start:207 stop:455 length:249 start_codon:yes stop_codon:yes gene_type:complete
MVMAEESDRMNPNWDAVNKLYDALDESIVDISQKEKLNFIEISMALQMINKKMEYEQFKAMFEFNMEGEFKTKEGQPDSMYR